MQKTRRILQQVAWGVGTGVGITLVTLLFGFAGGNGWQSSRAATALNIVVLIVLVLLGGLVTITEYGRHVGIKFDDETRERRLSTIPFLLSMTLSILAFYLSIG